MDSTKEKIQKEAMKEFLQYGYEGASLRQIVKNVGLTTGAFYRYYPNKEALFSDLVEEHASHLYKIYDNVVENFQQQDADMQTANMNDTSQGGLEEMLDYVYDHYDNFKLLLTAAEGTPYSDFLHNLAARETKSTLQYMDFMRDSGVSMPPIDEGLVHMISSVFFASVFEIVLHDTDYPTARKRISRLQMFYTGGWEKLFGVNFGKEKKTDE